MQSIATPTPLVFSQTTANNSCHNQNTDLEICLNTFVRRALHITSTGEYSVDTALAILDHAWIAQKLIWSLRE
ncbi:hypothetical protein B9G53_11605 [Pseudanabaena sp. SR411]|uniref:hypothetical protein n=1 Tax=Pseudanabaena sp. SR411 TaxID=1980935 RepID=UPI000B984185|nr:hypothetical protein [Pseudanabaena sp. SR411]OYQ64460.1 hypothetical protein B9G53_11605 [Pseudanabaena sp. SR411]